MGRLRRILLKAAAVGSVVVCVAALVSWPVSYWYVVGVVVADPRVLYPSSGGFPAVRRIFVVAADRGGVYFITLGESTEAGWHGIVQPCQGMPPETEFLGEPVKRWLPVRVFRLPEPGVPAGLVVLAHGAVVLAGAVVPLVVVVRWRRWRDRGRRGECPVCRYDLRATPERCPECGRAVAVGGGPGE